LHEKTDFFSILFLRVICTGFVRVELWHSDDRHLSDHTFQKDVDSRDSAGLIKKIMLYLAKL